MIKKSKIEDIDNISQLTNKVNNLNELINNYTLLRGDTENIGMKKSYEFFVSHLVKKKLKIEEIINDLYSSIIQMPSNKED